MYLTRHYSGDYALTALTPPPQEDTVYTHTPQDSFAPYLVKYEVKFHDKLIVENIQALISQL